MAKHVFNVEVATKYGINEAIFLENIYFWTKTNIFNGNNFNDGYFWTYNKLESFEGFMPYFSTQNIRTIIKNLVEKGAIQKGNYNKVKYDRTVWYALTIESLNLFLKDEDLETSKKIERAMLLTPDFPHMLELTNGYVRINKSICENQQIEKLELTNRSGATNKTIPDNKQDSNPDKKPHTENNENSVVISDKIKKEITRAKRNIYISRSWDKRADQKIKNLLEKENEEMVIDLLKRLYNVKLEIKTTLVQLISGIVKNMREETELKLETDNLKIEKEKNIKYNGKNIEERAPNMIRAFAELFSKF